MKLFSLRNSIVAPHWTGIFPVLVSVVFMSMAFTSVARSDASRFIWFGTTLDPQEVMTGARELAASLTDSTSSQWRAKGDQRRTYRFAEAGVDEPYRICVPADWNGTSELPLVMYLHGAGSNESTYLDMNNKQMVTLAAEHGFLLVSPKGDNGAYGNFLRLSAPFGNEAGAEQLMAQVTQQSERTNQLSEKDVINVLELVLHEYPVDRNAMFLSGHSMGSGGTWYIGGKYSGYWRALAPMSGPFVQESGYPWDSLRTIPVFVTEGIQTPSLEGSRAVRDWMRENGFPLKYEEVDADHGGMISLTLPHVFEFFDSCRTNPVAVPEKKSVMNMRHGVTPSVRYEFPHRLRLYVPRFEQLTDANISVLDVVGRKRFDGVIRMVAGSACITGVLLSPGVYRLRVQSGLRSGWATFVVTK